MDHELIEIYDLKGWTVVVTTVQEHSRAIKSDSQCVKILIYYIYPLLKFVFKKWTLNSLKYYFWLLSEEFISSK